MNRTNPLRRVMLFGTVRPMLITVTAWLLAMFKGDRWYDPAQLYEAVGIRPFTR